MNVFLWHKESLSVGGVLSWCWRLGELFKNDPDITVQNVDLRVLPMNDTPQAPFDPTRFFDRRIDTPAQFFALLNDHPDAFHVVNYSFEYLDVLQQSSPDLLRKLRLIGTCHTDEDYYYMSLLTHRAQWSRILTVSQRTQNVCQALFPELANRVALLPYYNIPLPAHPQPTPAHDPLRLLYLGRLCQHQKRILDLVELMRLLGDTPCQLTVIGEGQEKEKLRELMQPFGSRVIFKPSLPIWEVNEEYAQHDISLMVSEFEGNSISLMESMLMGLAPFVTRVGSGQERLRPGENGVLVPIGDMAEMARQIAYYQSHRDSLQAMKTDAQNTIRREIESARYKERFSQFLNN